MSGFSGPRLRLGPHDAVAEMQNTRRHRAREVFVVGSDEQRAIPADEGPKQSGQLGSPRRIQRRGRFVHQQHGGIHRQGASNGDALGLTSRQLPRQRMRAVFDAKRAQQLARVPFGVVERHAHGRGSAPA